jgi:hypothetical protein
MTPEERLDRVLSLRHGLIGPRGLSGPYDDNTQQLIKSVLGDPATYCPMIDERLRAPAEPLELAEPNESLRLGAALELAGLLGPEYCGSIVRRVFDELLRPYESLRSAFLSGEEDDAALRKSQAKQNCIALLIASLRILREFDDAHALDACMGMIESFRPEKGEAGEVYVMLRYMAQVAPQRPECRAELERMYSDRGSRLYHQPRLKQVIDAIDARASSTELGEHDPDSGKKGQGR